MRLANYAFLSNMPQAKYNEPYSRGAFRQLTANGNAAAIIVLTLRSRWRLVLPMVSALGAAGCGGAGGANMAPVHGIVTLDGQPLTEGFVFVTPAEGKMATGNIQSDGTFVLGTNSHSDGAKIGTHPVSVKPPPAQEGMPPSATAKSLPQHYRKASTSGLTVDVKPDTDNELKIELSTLTTRGRTN